MGAFATERVRAIFCAKTLLADDKKKVAHSEKCEFITKHMTGAHTLFIFAPYNLYFINGVRFVKRYLFGVVHIIIAIAHSGSSCRVKATKKIERIYLSRI